MLQFPLKKIFCTCEDSNIQASVYEADALKPVMRQGLLLF